MTATCVINIFPWPSEPLISANSKIFIDRVKCSSWHDRWALLTQDKSSHNQTNDHLAFSAPPILLFLLLQLFQIALALALSCPADLKHRHQLHQLVGWQPHKHQYCTGSEKHTICTNIALAWSTRFNTGWFETLATTGPARRLAQTHTLCLHIAPILHRIWKNTQLTPTWH